MNKSVLFLSLLVLMLFKEQYCQIKKHTKVASFEQKIQPIENLNLISYAQQCSDLAMNFETNAQYDSALYYYEKANCLFEKSFRYNEQINCLLDMGKIYFYQYNFDIAYDRAQQALKLARQYLDSDSLKIAECYHTLGMIEVEKNLFNNAKNYFKKELDIHLKYYDDTNPSMIVAYNDMGSVSFKLGEYDVAEHYFQQCLKIDSLYKFQHGSGITFVYNNLGLVIRDKNDFEKALKLFQMALEIGLKVYQEKHPFIASVYYNIAQIYRMKTDYSQAIFYHRKALNIRNSIFKENHPQIAESYMGIGKSYEYKGNFDLALSYENQALKILRESVSSNHPFVATSIMNIARSYYAKNEPDMALDLLTTRDNPLSIRKRTYGDKHAAVGDYYYLLGCIYIQKDQSELAIKNLKKALGIRLNLHCEKHTSVAGCYKYIGLAYDKSNNYMQALYNYNKAIQLSCIDGIKFDQYQNPETINPIFEFQLYETFFFKAKLYHKMSQSKENKFNNLIASFETYKKLVELLDRMRASYKSEDSKLNLAQKAAQVYDQAIDVTLCLYEITRKELYKDWAFYFAEKSKAGVLLESLTESRAKHFSKIPDSLLKKEKKMREELTFYEIRQEEQSLRLSNKDSTKFFKYNDKYFSLKTAYQSFLGELEKKYPKYYALKYQTATITPDQVQKNLKAGSALITYFIGDSTLYTFVISKYNYDVFSQSVDSSFFNGISNFHQLNQMQTVVKSRIKTKMLRNSHYLYNVLIKPIEPYVEKVNKLIIIPDPQLTIIPFEALIKSPQNQINDFVQADYLIRRYVITYHYSATLYVRGLKDQTLNKTNSFAGFAPVFDEKIGNGKIDIGYRSLIDTLKSQFTTRAFIEEQGRFSALPESEKEVTSIVDAFQHQHYDAVKFLHKDATEYNLKTAKKFHIIHIATHGVFNEKKPRLSVLVLSQPFQPQNDNDGFLYSGEVYNLNLDSDLIVLSSCESGAGKVVRGEGILALTRGFLYIGVPNIIFSLWKVTDKYTSRLMINFYIELLAGKPYAEALRNAKLNLINEKASAQPSCWSAFLYIGS